MLMPLSHLRVGEVARIGQLVGRDDDVRRLEELGLRVGRSIEMLQQGTACIVRVAGSKLCVRSTDAVGILVVASEVTAT